MKELTVRRCPRLSEGALSKCKRLARLTKLDISHLSDGIKVLSPPPPLPHAAPSYSPFPTPLYHLSAAASRCTALPTFTRNTHPYPVPITAIDARIRPWPAPC